MTKLDAALAAAQAEMPELVKDSTNPHFSSRFISLKGLLEQVLPVLRKHGLLLLQPPSNLSGQPALTTIIRHVETGDQIEATTPLCMAKQDAQGQGGAITYMRRYQLMSLLGLVADEDDDGNSASERPKRRTSSGGAGSTRKPASAVAGDEAHSPGADSNEGYAGFTPDQLP